MLLQIFFASPLFIFAQIMLCAIFNSSIHSIFIVQRKPIKYGMILALRRRNKIFLFNIIRLCKQIKQSKDIGIEICGIIILYFITNLFLFLDLKLRRQHWCFLLLLFFLLLLGLFLFTSSSTSSTSANNDSLLNSPELQRATVAQLLKEVPLIDGLVIKNLLYFKILNNVFQCTVQYFKSTHSYIEDRRKVEVIEFKAWENSFP